MKNLVHSHGMGLYHREIKQVAHSSDYSELNIMEHLQGQFGQRPIAGP